ncbi:hypothetical protein SODALDRAFT_135717 [Sodiomyces alkalinus F11]|uniref:Uncharacterized protein n=1 Tax=Sodiomyces alkalinus (strain CBS 110278 / VKM F-3762 / F11) TaxID=1314773 RepID=A0A3N2PYU0_SODAK|nr:hypothetical protein SODALDRAFT_135717 [Sodiomyces alkalinus F11]ROT39690.1 hypothetical protein SODALDRAFT_135717 [Sodiomyces alkalinus F11]
MMLWIPRKLARIDWFMLANCVLPLPQSSSLLPLTNRCIIADFLVSLIIPPQPHNGCSHVQISDRSGHIIPASSVLALGGGATRIWSMVVSDKDETDGRTRDMLGNAECTINESYLAQAPGWQRANPHCSAPSLQHDNHLCGLTCYSRHSFPFLSS